MFVIITKSVLKFNGLTPYREGRYRIGRREKWPKKKLGGGRKCEVNV